MWVNRDVINKTWQERTSLLWVWMKFDVDNFDNSLYQLLVNNSDWKTIFKRFEDGLTFIVENWKVTRIDRSFSLQLSQKVKMFADDVSDRVWNVMWLVSDTFDRINPGRSIWRWLWKFRDSALDTLMWDHFSNLQHELASKWNR